ncbi:hypothetical protein HMN09_00890400 [Mycena chlorophos]|uniref:Uncharacterized protein n=1 Tax=Mycena chlorophos TaxID=658473 RepID=A0A8H6W7X9_MYCCL|nr:hypothetical protein HMN09_00890400 [Mycena chlorophos]
MASTSPAKIYLGSKKRVLETGDTPPAKIQKSMSRSSRLNNDSALNAAKVHPFFAKPAKPVETGPFRWESPFGATKSCLHGVNLEPKSSTKVAALDLDGTVIVQSFNGVDFRWWNKCVPGKLAELSKEGYSIVFFSNQAGLKSDLTRDKWKKKVGSIAAALPDVPFRIFAALKKDKYRKPDVGMWEELETLFAADNVEIDKSASFFVGDAAGRPKTAKREKDFHDSDKEWAAAVGIPFFTPEEYFLGEPSESKS